MNSPFNRWFASFTQGNEEASTALEAEVEYIPPEKGQPAPLPPAAPKQQAAKPVPDHGIVIVPGHTVNIPPHAEDASFAFVLDNVRCRVISFKQIDYGGGDEQRALFLEYGLYYFRKKQDYIGRGYVSLHTREFSKALEDFNIALQRAPEDFEAHLGIGLAKKGLGRTDYLVDLRKAHTFAPQSRAKKIWEIIESEKKALSEEESDEEYFSDLDARQRPVFELDEEPEHNVVYTEDGRVILNKEASEGDYEYVADLVSGGGRELEHVLVEDGDPAHAERFLRFADQLFFARNDYLNCGISRAYLRDFRTAYEFLEAVRTVDFKNPRAHKWAGVVKYNLGHVEDALEDLRHAEELDPSLSDWVCRYVSKKEREAGEQLASGKELVRDFNAEAEQESNARILKLRDRFLRHYLGRMTKGMTDPDERKEAAQRVLHEIIENQRRTDAE